MGHRGQEHLSTRDSATDSLAAALNDTASEARLRQAQRRDERQERASAGTERLHGLAKLKAMREDARRRDESAEGGAIEHQPASSAPPAATQIERIELPANNSPTLQALADVTQDIPGESDPDNWPRLVGLAVVALFVGAAGVAGFTLTLDEYERDTSTYTRTVYKPVEPKDMQVYVGYTPIRANTDRATERRATPRRPIVSPVGTAAPAIEPTPAPKSAKKEPAVNVEAKKPAPMVLPQLDDETFDPFADTP